jgi:hypothetical protein
MSVERWLPVVGYEGLYEVSDLGRVRSLDRRHRSARGNATQLHRGRLLKPLRQSGYLAISLCRDGNQKIRQVQGLVLAAFVGPRPEGMQACHGPDPDPTNCRLDNLRWDTKRANQLDRLTQGARDYRGSTNGNAKLVETDVERIRDIHRVGAQKRHIAEWIGISDANVRLILAGKAWRHVALPTRASAGADCACHDCLDLIAC